MANSKITNHSQERANFAFEKVTEAKVKLKKNATEFKSHVKKVPLMIRGNGLVAAYAFVHSKAKGGKDKENDYHLILALSLEWLREKSLISGEMKVNEENFTGVLAQLDRSAYRLARRELLSMFTWLKRFADGMIKKESGKEGEDGK